MFTRAIRWAYVVFVWIILAAVVVQFFLAGLGVFAGGSSFETHRNFGYTISFVMLFGLLAALAARLPWRTIGLTALLPLLVALQSVFVALRDTGQTGLAALHVVNGLAIFSLASYLALRSRTYVAVQVPMSVDVATPPQ